MPQFSTKKSEDKLEHKNTHCLRRQREHQNQPQKQQIWETDWEIKITKINGLNFPVEKNNMQGKKMGNVSTNTPRKDRRDMLKSKTKSNEECL